MQVRLVALFAVVGAISAVLPAPRLALSNPEHEVESPMQQQLLQEFLVKYKSGLSAPVE